MCYLIANHSGLSVGQVSCNILLSFCMFKPRNFICLFPVTIRKNRVGSGKNDLVFDYLFVKKCVFLLFYACFLIIGRRAEKTLGWGFF